MARLLGQQASMDGPKSRNQEIFNMKTKFDHDC